jgi:hypothetical protein
MNNVENCVELFDYLYIYSHKDFKKWALKNHPDKGGSYHLNFERFLTANICLKKV